MTDDDAKDAIDYLRACGLANISRGSMWDLEMCTKTIATIERLTAEVERLTPKPMTLKEIAAVFNEHMIHDRDDWEADDCAVFCRHADDLLDAGDATLMAYGLLRVAGPIIVQEPATREEVNP